MERGQKKGVPWVHRVSNSSTGSRVAQIDTSTGDQDKLVEHSLSVLYDVSCILLESTNLEDTARRLLQAIGGGLDWERGAFWLVDHTTSILFCSATWYLSPIEASQYETAIRRASFPVGAGLPGRVFATGRPIWVRDVLRDSNFSSSLLAAYQGARSAFAFPIRGEGGVLGAIELSSRETRLPDEALIRTMISAGIQIGQFIEKKRTEEAMCVYNARREEELSRLLRREQEIRAEAEAATNRLEALLSVTDTALTYLSLDDLLREMLVRIREIMNVDNSTILLTSEDRGYLTVRDVLGPEEEVARYVSVPIGQGFAGRIVTLAEPLIVDDPSTVEIINPALRDKIRSLLGVPMMIEGQVIGVIHVGTTNSRRFTTADIQLFQRVADRVALAIAQSRLYGAEQRARKEAVIRASQLEAIIDAMADAVSIYDSEARLLQVNKAAQDLYALDTRTDFFSLPVDERVSQMVVRDEQGQLLPREQWPMLRILRGEVLKGTDTVEMISRTLDGREVQLSVSGAPVRDSSGHIIGGVLVVRDVSERRQLEQRTHDALNALLALAESLVLPPDESHQPEELAPDTLTAIRKVAGRLAELTSSVLGCRRVWISILEPETEILKAVAAVGLTSEQQANSLQDNPTLELVSRLRSNEVLTLDMTKPPFNIQPDHYASRVVFCAPMIVGDQLAGLLALDHGGLEHTYTQEEIALARAVAKLAALVIERERLLHERADAQANELALRESHQRMDEFLSMASHELRTPLTTIKGNVQLSERQLKNLANKVPLSGEATKKVAMIQGLLERADHQIGFLNRLMGDLLDVSRIRSNMLELHVRPEPCDLATILQEAVEDQRRALPRRSISFELPPGRVVPVIVDPERIRQVVTNYLTNALKYSFADRPVEVFLRVEEHVAHVSVRDEGPGLPLTEQERIWDQFYRAPGIEVQSGSSVGLGLGLHICRTIIERHQGQVGVQSTPGEGSTFWFVLPLVDDA